MEACLSSLPVPLPSPIHSSHFKDSQFFCCLLSLFSAIRSNCISCLLLQQQITMIYLYIGFVVVIRLFTATVLDFRPSKSPIMWFSPDQNCFRQTKSPIIPLKHLLLSSRWNKYLSLRKRPNHHSPTRQKEESHVIFLPASHLFHTK